MYIAPCMNATETDYDEDPAKTGHGWGIRNSTDPVCASDEEIKIWLTKHKKTIRIKSFEEKVDF